MALGNISTSSLIRNAISTRERNRNYEDQLVKFDFDNSAKTFEDYQSYISHVDSRIATTGDPSKILTYQIASRSAYRTYASHEIQRQTQNVMAGAGSLEGKIGTIQSLQQTAMAMGDSDTAQSLNGQLISLDIQLNNQYEKAARDQRRTYLSELDNFVDAQVDQVDAAIGIANDTLKQSGLDRVNEIGEKALRDAGIIDKLVADGKITQEQADGLSVGYFGVQYYAMQDALSTLENQLSVTPADDLEATEEIEDAIAKIRNSKYEVPGYSSQVTYKEFSELTRMEEQGISPFRQGLSVNPITGAMENVLELQPIEKYSYVKRSDGTFERVNNFAKWGQKLLFESENDSMTEATKQQRRDAQDALITKLTEAGFNVMDTANGQLIVEQTEQSFRNFGSQGFGQRTEDGGFKIQGNVPQQLALAVSDDGSITFTDQNNKVKQLDLDNQEIKDYLPEQAREAFDKLYEEGFSVNGARVGRDESTNLLEGAEGDTITTEAIRIARERRAALQNSLTQQGLNFTESIDSSGTPTVTVVSNIDGAPSTPSKTVKGPTSVQAPSRTTLRSAYEESKKTGKTVKTKNSDGTETQTFAKPVDDYGTTSVTLGTF